MVSHKYSTSAGVFTRDEAYRQLTHHLREAADFAAMLSHLHKTEDSNMDILMAKGWLGVHELILRMIHQITSLAANKFIKH